MTFNFKDARDRFFWGSFWHDDNCRKLDVCNPNDVVLAVNKAYDDMTPRTISGLGLSEDKLSTNDKKNKNYINLKTKKKNFLDGLRNDLAQKIVDEVFIKNIFNDTVHNDLCNHFKTQFEKVINDLNKDIVTIQSQIPAIKEINIKKITYGKAQKIVNMSMKYLYFFDDANNYVSTVFNKCHMAIDEYIMKFFDSKGYKRKVDRWSNFDKKTYNDYRTEVVNDYCSKDGKLPFFAEFDYWNQGRKLP